MLGVFANSGGVLVGGLIGLLFSKKIKAKYTDAVLVALALASGMIGVTSAIGSADSLCLIICVAVGALVGELLHIDEGIERLGAMAERRFSPKDGEKGLTQGFVTCTVIFCVGSMSVMGSLEAGISGNMDILFAKSVLDLIAATAFAAGMGAGVALSAVSVLVAEGGMCLLAGLIAPYLTQEVVVEMSAVGGLLLIGTTVNLLGLREERIKVANLLPGIFLPIAYLPLSRWLGGLFL